MPESKSKKLLVYDVLKQRIIAQVMKPGEPINEGSFPRNSTSARRRFGKRSSAWKERASSRMSRERELCLPISIQDLRELFEIREMLECEAIKRRL